MAASICSSWQSLTDDERAAFGSVAGHSVGEIAALVAAGVISNIDGMRLVGERGRAMAKAAAEADTGMSAVIGGKEPDVLEAIADAGLQPANFNGGGQIVAAGDMVGLQSLSENAPRGTRVIALQVAGAFHTRYMASASSALQSAVDAIGSVSDPVTDLWTNSDGSVVADGARALELIVHQVQNPVRWDLCMAGFADRGITGLVEFSPAGALVGLAKRGLRGTPSVALTSPDDLRPQRATCSPNPPPDRRTPKDLMNVTLKQAPTTPYTRILAMGAARGENAVRTTTWSARSIRATSGSASARGSRRARARTRKRRRSTYRSRPRNEAIATSGIDPSEVDLVIVATISNPRQSPSVSAIVADAIGATPAAAYDSNAACACS